MLLLNDEKSIQQEDITNLTVYKPNEKHWITSKKFSDFKEDIVKSITVIEIFITTFSIIDK